MAGPPTASELLRLLTTSEGIDSALLTAAESYFQSKGHTHHARWVRLEREGYGARTELANLQDILGPASSPEVTEAVLRGRLRYGTVVLLGVARQWPHFFVEPIDDLRRWQQRLATSGVGFVQVELDQPPDAARPRQLAFPREVFTDVLNSIAQEIADAVRRAE